MASWVSVCVQTCFGGQATCEVAGHCQFLACLLLASFGNGQEQGRLVAVEIGIHPIRRQRMNLNHVTRNPHRSEGNNAGGRFRMIQFAAVSAARLARSERTPTCWIVWSGNHGWAVGSASSRPSLPAESRRRQGNALRQTVAVGADRPCVVVFEDCFVGMGLTQGCRIALALQLRAIVQ